jgi:RimJ/RimL family protein N-acetyltransferase
MPKDIPFDRISLTPLEREDLPMLECFLEEACCEVLAPARDWETLCSQFEEGALSGDPRHAFIVRLDGMPAGYCSANLGEGAVRLGLPAGTPQRPSVALFSLRWAVDLIFSTVWHHDRLTVQALPLDDEMRAAAKKAGLKLNPAGGGFTVTRKAWEGWKHHPVRDRVEDVPQGGVPLTASQIKYTPACADDIPFLTRLHNASFQFYNRRPLSMHAVEKRFAKGEYFGENTHIFIVRVKGEPVGIARVQDVKGASPEVGLRLLGPWQARGIGGPATQWLLDYCFTKLPRRIVKVRAVTVKDNIGGNKALRKAGFKKEGKMRRQWFIRGQWRDAAIYSMLREEWEEMKHAPPTTAKPKLKTKPKPKAKKK